EEVLPYRKRKNPAATAATTMTRTSGRLTRRTSLGETGEREARRDGRRRGRAQGDRELCAALRGQAHEREDAERPCGGGIHVPEGEDVGRGVDVERQRASAAEALVEGRDGALGDGAGRAVEDVEPAVVRGGVVVHRARGQEDVAVLHVGDVLDL